MSEWVDINKMIPNDFDKLLVVVKGEVLLRTYSEGDWFNEHGQSTMNISGYKEDVSFWKFAPEPPEPSND